MPNWRKISRLSPGERRLLAQALILLPATAVGVRLLGLRRFHTILASRAPASGPSEASPGESSVSSARAAARIVDVAAARGPYRANCLQRSLTLWWLLRRQRVASDLRIGARRTEAGLDAHAWVELAGQVLNDEPSVGERFPPFPGFVAPQERTRP